PALNEEGPQHLLTGQDDPLLALERRTENGRGRAVILVNTQAHEPRTVALETFSPNLADVPVTLAPLEVRVVGAEASRTDRPVMHHGQWRSEGRMQIEEVYPELDGGRYPVRRIIGDWLEVWADIFRDGHDKLRAVLKYRHEDEDWRETPFTFYDNDRWVARLRLDAVGLWRYTIEAWTDQFESWCDEVEKKREAGQNVELDLIEGRALVEAALQ